MSSHAAVGRVPPGPPRSATLSLLRKLNGDRLSLMTRAAAEYGDAVRVAIGPKVLYLFNSPESAKHVLADNAANYHKGIGLVQAKRAIGDGLLTSEGALWKEQRKIIKPVFQSRRISSQAGIVADEAAKLVARLRAHAGQGPVNVVEEMTGLTLGVLGRALLDADLDQFESIGHSFESVQDQAMFEMVTLGAVPQWVPLPKQRRFRAARSDLDRIVAHLVADREARPRDGDDVVSRLVASTAKEADPEVGRNRLRDELVTLLLAGHETTASTLSWSFHLLDRHPEVAEKLHAEAVEVLGDRLPVAEDMRRLPYTGRVVQEVMRLYPPVWILTRQAQQADVVAGYGVPAGADVLVCPYALHRHPGLWDRPGEFDPDRFLPENSTGRPAYAYLPFGAGPRFCVGNTLGLMEAAFVLAMVARELRLTGTGAPVTAEPMLSLRVKDGLPMSVSTRPASRAADSPAA